MAETNPGDGSSNPFGNGRGGAAGYGGAPRDFTSLTYTQKAADPNGGANPDSIPSGGKYPPADVPAQRSANTILPGNNQAKPFKLKDAASTPPNNPPPETGGSDADLPVDVAVPLCSKSN